MKLKIIFLLAIVCASALAQEMTPQLFREIADAPADNKPLDPKLIVGHPLWTNAIASITMKYAAGTEFSENVEITAKGVRGKYVVTTFKSQFYKETMSSILTYDKKAGALKSYAFADGKLLAATITTDPKTKTFKAISSYGNGFTEVTEGSYSKTNDVERTVVKRNGDFFMSREVSTRPVLVEK